MEPHAARAAYLTSEGVELESDLADVDLRAVAQGMPVRLPPSYAGQRNYPGLFWSSTNGRHVVYESLLELAWLWLADFDASIVRVSAQPLRIVGWDGGRQRVRYPDFLALDHSVRARVVDVKPADLLDEPEVKASLSWTSSTMRCAGIDYSVWSGAPATVLRNIRLAASARRPGLVPDDAVHAAVTHCPAGGCGIGDLEARIRQTSTWSSPRTAILAALWQSLLRCDMSRPITADSHVEAAA
ncbi:TnsA-like heteromeric transposase endonuclease subunit [Cellulomonas marina]|uniref:TnsA endonuclease N terminal n=1 Tax=Cellulomonas marina TaxID=988821 RepID=A0A1I1A3U1_9CELL|nr:TnsA-like heteromeric transposase endonuclease subunit [Cellulomonas marina]GIG30786.1 hypothetical protein Cma02nite_33860 [Cellulomonas marina]SFB32621.1 hypothetical protein SAMN05421867_1153 [Cellulomonas marina]